jgi:iron complex outermembrane receptor protein
MKCLLILAAFLFFWNDVFAQEMDTIRLKEVIIMSQVNSGSRRIEISHADVFNKSAGELMQKIPGVSITKRSSFSIEPMINAFKYDQVNTVINGCTCGSGSCPNRMDPIMTRISPEEIKEIEVIRGPYQVRNGQIMGGYINLVTNKDPHYEKLTFGGGIATEYNFNGEGSLSSVQLNGGNQLFDLHMNANYRKFDNYISGDGTEISSSYNTYSINTSLGINISENQRIYVDYIYSEARNVMHAGLPMDAKFDKSHIYSMDYSYRNIGSVVSSFQMTLYGAKENHLMTNEYRPNARAALANTPVWSDNLGGSFEFMLNPLKKGVLYLGADYKQISKDGFKEVRLYKNVCANPPVSYDPPKEMEFSVWQNSQSQDLGVFMDLKYYFSEKLKFSTGIRTDYIKNYIRDPDQDFLELYNGEIHPDDISTFNYYVQFNYDLPDNYNIEISAGHGTRNPNLLEQFINHFTVGLDAYEYVGNPHLKVEKNNQVNLSLSKKHEFFYAYLDVFYSRMRDYISAVEDTTIQRKFTPCKDPKFAKRFININKAQQYGVNFGGNIQFLKYFNAGLDFTWVYAQNLDFDEPLPEIAPFTSMISVGYKFKNIRLNLQNESQAKQTRVAVSMGERESEAFSVFNINVSYLFFSKLILGMAIDNIFDKNYYRHLSRPYKNMDVNSMFYEPGRNFKIYLRYNF